MKISGMIIGIALMSTVAAQAQQLQTRECTPSNIAFVAEAIAKMVDGKQKKRAADEIGLASEAMAQGKNDECKEHLMRATLQSK